MPKPVKAPRDQGFSLRLISEADSRYAVVKAMRQRLEQLIEDAGLTSVQQEWLAARAVFLVAYLESLEVDAMEGKQIEWGSYVQSVNALSGVLNKIGLDRQLRKDVNTLEQYTALKKSAVNGSHKRRKKERD